MYDILLPCRCPPSARDPELEALDEEDNCEIHDEWLARQEVQVELQTVQSRFLRGANEIRDAMRAHAAELWIHVLHAFTSNAHTPNADTTHAHTQPY